MSGNCGGGSGEPLSLFSGCHGINVGGWLQLGYHDQNLPLFNSRKHEVQLQQAWLYAEKEIDTEYGIDIGGRVDYLYGTDAQDTQAFGIANSHWDNQWDSGGDYGQAIPQAFLELGYGSLSIKAGRFFTIIGHEVVSAPDNFFYSHAYTFNNSEPFTHTGAIITYDAGEFVDIYGGYVLGWDSAFEDNGDAVIGGTTVNLSDAITFTWTGVGGRFADNSGGDERGFMYSAVTSFQLSDQIQYILQHDWLDTEDVNGATVRDTVGLNNYLLLEISDCLSVGARFEWWNVSADSQGFYGDNAVPGFASTVAGDYNIYAFTFGANFKPHPNIIVRPEIRRDWVRGNLNNLASSDIEFLEGNSDEQSTFGIDTIFLF